MPSRKPCFLMRKSTLMTSLIQPFGYKIADKQATLLLTRRSQVKTSYFSFAQEGHLSRGHFLPRGILSV